MKWIHISITFSGNNERPRNGETNAEMSEFLVACYATLHPTLFVCPSVGLSLSVCHIYLFIFLCFDLTAPHATGVAMYLASYFDRNRIIFIVHFSKLGLSELESLKSQPLQKFIQKSLLMKEYKKSRNMQNWFWNYFNSNGISFCFHIGQENVQKWFHF